MRWLAVRCPELPLEVLTRGLDPAPPLAVCEQYRVLQVSDTARTAGVEPGMRLATARGLCDGLQSAARHAAREQQALYRLGYRLLDVTPRVSVEPPDTLLLEIGSCLRLFGGLDPLRARAEELLADSGYSYRTAIGPTPRAAEQLTALPPEASRACHDAEDPEAAFRALLNELPLAGLRLPDQRRQRLMAPGFRTLGEILALPRATLGRRHGRAFLHWLEQLLGERPDERDWLQPPERFRAEQEFADPVAETNGLVFPMRRLLEELAAHLRRRQESITALRWHFHPLKGPVQTLTVGRARPAHEARAWLELTERKLEHFQLAEPVLVLELESGRPRRRAVEAGALFTDPEARPDRHELLDRLAALPGLDCHTPRETDEPLPEAADRAADPASAPTAGSASEPIFRQRPLWLLDPPRRLQQGDGGLFWDGALLEWLPGAERYSSHWWQNTPRVREYHIVRHPDGFCAQVFRDRRSGVWYLQGLF